MKIELSQTIWFCRDNFLLAMLFWEDMITCLVCLKYFYFLYQYELFFCITWIWTFMPQWKKITLWIMLGSIPHQKFSFLSFTYSRTSRNKLGDAWYVSNVSIIFDCSMLLYYPFWMFMGFTLHICITFGTNLLTRGPAHIVVLLTVSVFRRKGISNRVQTEWNL